MPNFRCSTGHTVSLVFGPENIRQSCPMCGVDVYKFRDAVLEEELMPATAGAAPQAPEQAKAIRRYLRLAGALSCGVLAAGAGVVLIGMREHTAPPARPQGPVIPIVSTRTSLPAALSTSLPGVRTKTPAPTVTSSAKGDPDNVSITNFHAIETDSNTVQLRFRLTNRGNTPNPYPALLLHWHGIANAHQVFRNDSYAHPPLPFRAADIELVLARPDGANGVDVKIAY